MFYVIDSMVNESQKISTPLQVARVIVSHGLMLLVIIDAVVILMNRDVWEIASSCCNLNKVVPSRGQIVDKSQ